MFSVAWRRRLRCFLKSRSKAPHWSYFGMTTFPRFRSLLFVPGNKVQRTAICRAALLLNRAAGGHAEQGCHTLRWRFAARCIDARP
jgi:hypothetical protein